MNKKDLLKELQNLHHQWSSYHVNYCCTLEQCQYADGKEDGLKDCAMEIKSLIDNLEKETK